MIVYRLCKTKYVNDFSGKGASLYGGRWNEIGTSVLYTGYNVEICLLEMLVNIEFSDMVDFSILTLEIPDSIYEVCKDDLPENWRFSPPPLELLTISQEFIRANNYYAMKVPSAIVPTAFNFILNCNHPLHEEMKCLDIQLFDVDKRFILG